MICVYCGAISKNCWNYINSATTAHWKKGDSAYNFAKLTAMWRVWVKVLLNLIHDKTPQRLAEAAKMAQLLQEMCFYLMVAFLK